MSIIIIGILSIIIYIVGWIIIQDRKDRQQREESLVRMSFLQSKIDRFPLSSYIAEIFRSVTTELNDGEYEVIIKSLDQSDFNKYPMQVVHKNNPNIIIGYLFDDAILYTNIKHNKEIITTSLFIEKYPGIDRKSYELYIEKKYYKKNYLEDPNLYSSIKNFSQLPDITEFDKSESLNDDFDNDDDLLDDILFDSSDYSYTDTSIEIPIKGINFRNLDDSHIGIFDGCIMHDKYNKYDKYAIGIYGNDGTLFGFVEKGQINLCNKIEDTGGFITGQIKTYSFFADDKNENRIAGTFSILKTDLI